MNIHSNNWTPLLHGNNEMIYRAHQNRQIDTSVPFMINLFQIHWKRVVTNIGSQHVYYEIFKHLSADIIWAFTHDIYDIKELMQSFYDPRGIHFYDFMKNYDSLIKIIDINIPVVSSFMEVSLQKNLKETLGLRDIYYGFTIKDYLAHISINNDVFTKNLTEDLLESSNCPVCMSPIKDASSIVGGSCGHLICISCFTHTLAENPQCCICRSEMKRIMHISRQQTPSSIFSDYKLAYGAKKGYVLWILKMLSIKKTTSIVIIDNNFFIEQLHPNLRMFLTQTKFDFLNSINIYYNQKFKNEAFKRIHHSATNTSNVFFITYDDAFMMSTYQFETSRFRHLQIDSVFVFSPPSLSTGFLRKSPEQISKCASRFIYNIQSFLGHDVPISLVSMV